MQRQNVIILERCPNIIQCWGNFKRACEENELPYHSLKMKKFPIVYKDWIIRKIEFNGKNETVLGYKSS